MREVTLPSGAILKINPARFDESKALHQALLREFNKVHIDADLENEKVDVVNPAKDALCLAFSSQEVEACLWKCLIHCTYNDGASGDSKILPITFEPQQARGDFIEVCVEVAQDNIAPFVKSLYAKFRPHLVALASGKNRG
jgi:hypothetical protein